MSHILHRRLVGNLLQQTYNMIDAAIVGRFLGTQALAGVGATSSVQFLVLGFCTGLCSGFGVPVARDFGANQFGRMRKDIFHGALLTAVIAVILTTGCVLLCPWILKMLSVTEDIYGNARIYILIIFLGLPFTLLYNFLSSILRAVGDSRTPFLFLAFSACLNVVLDLICIIVFKWGCAGAAFATITAQAISGLCCLIFIIKKVQILHPKRKDCHLQPVYVKEMLVMGLPMGLQFSITAIGSMVMQSANNGLGSIYVSGFTAGMRIKQFAMCPFDALANGVSVFCSQNLGAGKIKRIRKGLWQGVGVGFIYGLLIGLVLIFAGRPLSMLFISADQTAVLDASAKYLRCLRFLLLESRTAQCLQNECPGNGLLRKSDFLGRNGNDCTNLCQLCFCRNIRIYSHLFCRSDSMGFSNIIYYAGVPDVSETGNKRA